MNKGHLKGFSLPNVHYANIYNQKTVKYLRPQILTLNPRYFMNEKKVQCKFFFKTCLGLWRTMA